MWRYFLFFNFYTNGALNLKKFFFVSSSLVCVSTLIYIAKEKYHKHDLGNLIQFRKFKHSLKQAGIDQPFLKLHSVNGKIVLGGAVTWYEADKIKAICKEHYSKDNIIDLTNGRIGNWNLLLAREIKFKMFLNANIRSRNFFIYAIKKTVWVIGVANNIFEKEEILRILNEFKEKGVILRFHSHIAYVNTKQNGFVYKH